MKVVRLEVQNVKRIRAVRISPGDGSTVIIGGQNAQGKTSVLDAIEMALGGGKTLPEEPIRRGAKQATIIADLGEIIVERVISRTGTTLTVRDADGTKRSSPQTLLDKLCSKVSFDPLAFSRMDGSKQNDVLRQLLGLDFSELDRARERAYSKRTDVGKEARRVRALAESILVPPSTPAEPVKVADLLAQLAAANEAKGLASARKFRIAQVQAKLTETERAYDAAKAVLDRAEQARMAARMAVKAAEREPEVTLPDTAELEQAIRDAEITNRNVQRRIERDGHEARAGQLDADVADLTTELEAIDGQKHTALAAAQFPVPGLALADEGPTLNGVALSQASAAEKLRVSVGIGLALNPEVKVLLVRDASLLDEQSLAMVAEMATAAGAQVWLERVGTGDPSAVVISDGQVDESALPANQVREAAS